MGKEWTEKLIWARTHFCYSQINNFPGVVSSGRRLFVFAMFSTTRRVGETGLEGQTDGRTDFVYEL
jgi:hypothetical protein